MSAHHPAADESAAPGHAAPAPGSETLSAAQACRLLRVKPQTLYTYVSRGLIRSVAQLGARSRSYYREDVEKVRALGLARRGSGAAAESAMRWGQPVINTSITEITPEGPRYRGWPALELARGARSFEAVAELLWAGILHPEPVSWDDDPVPPAVGGLLDRVLAEGALPPALRIFAIGTTMLGAAERSDSEIRRGTTIRAARQLIQMLAGCLGYLGPSRSFRAPGSGLSVAENAARALKRNPSRDTVAAINAALVLCADHELSSSTFAARVAASTGAELRACVLAAIGAHSGTRLGGGCDRAEELLRGASGREQIRSRLESLEQSGSRVPGFNLVLYPRGDPRARYLLALAQAAAPRREATRMIGEFIAEAERQLSLRPSIEIGMVALAAALSLPPHSAGALWTLGRTAGWIAHVMEQRLAGFVLRPRARYVSSA